MNGHRKCVLLVEKRNGVAVLLLWSSITSAQHTPLSHHMFLESDKETSSVAVPEWENGLQ